VRPSTVIACSFVIPSCSRFLQLISHSRVKETVE
jgi:hypothetical protein